MLKKAQWKITCRQLEILKIMGRDETPAVMKEGPISGDWMKGGSLEGKSKEYLAGYYAGLQEALEMIRDMSKEEGANGGTEQDAKPPVPGMA